MWTVKFQMFKLVLEKAEEPEIKFPTSSGSLKKQESSRKTSISALLTMPKPLTVWIIINCGKFWKRREYQTTWPASWETWMQVRKQQLELDMEHVFFLNYSITQIYAPEKAMATHSSTLAWKIPWMEEPGWLQSMGSQRVGHDCIYYFYLFGCTGSGLQLWNLPCSLQHAGSLAVACELLVAACGI